MCPLQTSPRTPQQTDPISVNRPKRCFLVLGPESAGNRLTTAVLIAGGCLGSSTTRQPFDCSADPHVFVPPRDGTDKVVWHRSLPYRADGLWLDLDRLLRSIRLEDYEVFVVVPVRDPTCIDLSAQAHPHQTDHRRAYAEVFTFVTRNGLPWTFSVFESLILHPEPAAKALLARCGLQLEAPLPEVKDTDAKHWQEK